MKIQIVANKILVGTHHKTGCVWMRKILWRICRQFNLIYCDASSKGILNDDFDILFDNHSRFILEPLPVCYKGFHLIRDPRDIIISGSLYHQKSDEKWLHRKRKEFSGLTYQEKINSYSSIDDQIFFEMENTAYITIRDIEKWDYGNKNFIEIKYESLIEDIDLMLFHKIFTFLGFPGRLIPELLNIAYENSIFSGKVKRSTHVRSGKKNQWQDLFKAKHKKRFLELFGNILVRLEYEKDNNW